MLDDITGHLAGKAGGRTNNKASRNSNEKLELLVFRLKKLFRFELQLLPLNMAYSYNIIFITMCTILPLNVIHPLDLPFQWHGIPR